MQYSVKLHNKTTYLMFQKFQFSLIHSQDE